jgi:Outer membrane lipoprotein carrier protein LolA
MRWSVACLVALVAAGAPAGRIGAASATAVSSPAIRPAGAPAATDPWRVLTEARAEFERAAWTADFVQTYVPAGFTSGERESGRVSLALPGALRWDYEVPYPKVFLVLADTAYTWNPGETAGRRVVMADDERQHMALLRLDLEALAKRYTAASSTTADGLIEVALTPTDEAEIQDAVLTFEPRHHRLVALRYADLERNVTEFSLSGHRVASGEDLFAPPPGIEWLDE